MPNAEFPVENFLTSEIELLFFLPESTEKSVSKEQLSMLPLSEPAVMGDHLQENEKFNKVVMP